MNGVFSIRTNKKFIIQMELKVRRGNPKKF